MYLFDLLVQMHPFSSIWKCIPIQPYEMVRCWYLMVLLKQDSSVMVAVIYISDVFCKKARKVNQQKCEKWAYFLKAPNQQK